MQELSGNCNNLSSIYIPANVNSIAADAFTGCTSLENIEVDSQNTYCSYDSVNGLLTGNNGSSILFISDKVLSSITTFEIPEGIINFESNINAYSNITTIKIPESLQTISTPNMLPTSISNVEVNENNNYFMVSNDCLYNKAGTRLIMCYTKEKTVELLDTVTILNNYSFYQAINLTNVSIPNSVTTINDCAFQNNRNLENINIGPNVSYISPTFKYINYSGIVTIDANNENYSVEDDVLYNKDKTEMIAVLKQIVGKFNVRDSVTVIGDRAFYSQEKMTEVELPEGLIEIRANAFRYCTSLESIYIPASVETIASTAFSEASNLQSIQIDKAPGDIIGSPWGAIRGDRIVEWLRD